MLGQLDGWVVIHSALQIGMLHCTLGLEFTPRWWQTLYLTQAQHLLFCHDFICFDTIICLSNLSCELWNRKLKRNKISFYFQKHSFSGLRLEINFCFPSFKMRSRHVKLYLPCSAVIVVAHIIFLKRRRSFISVKYFYFDRSNTQ